jgi:hypothetical protein
MIRRVALDMAWLADTGAIQAGVPGRSRRIASDAKPAKRRFLRLLAEQSDGGMISTGVVYDTVPPVVFNSAFDQGASPCLVQLLRGLGRRLERLAARIEMRGVNRQR